MTTIAIIGRPNVGKSLLFNRLTQTRNALVADQPGVTRDRQYGIAEYKGRDFVVVDTGGLYDPHETDDSISQVISRQVFQAIEEADIVFWLVDGRSGITAADELFAQHLRTLSLNLHLIVNKTEDLDVDTVCSEFYALGLDQPIPISAKQGNGISNLMDIALATIPHVEPTVAEIATGTRIGLIGRPNVGKSSLANCIIGEERMLTFSQPGTTRDAIEIPFQWHDRDYVLVDTAGIRRRSRVTDALEKFSILKALQTVEKVQIVVLVMDAKEAITEQDLTLLGLAVESGKSLIIAINKWDGLHPDQKQLIKNQVDRKLGFASHACIHFISALRSTGIKNLFKSVKKIEIAQSTEIKPSIITKILHEAVVAHPPPFVRGRRIKLRFVHLGGRDPLRLVIHGNQTQHVPASYQRYLANTFCKRLKLTGTPVLIQFRQSDNPFKDKKTKPSRHKKTKRKRLTKRKV